MRAYTKKKHEIRKRFTVVIGVAAVGVMALGAQTVTAQTAAQPPAVVTYDTALTISCVKSGCLSARKANDPHRAAAHGGLPDRTFMGTVWSEHVPTSLRGPDRQNLVEKCMDGRRVILFKQRPGADRKLGTDQSSEGDPTIPSTSSGDWRVSAPKDALDHGARIYARVTPKVGDGFVCRADRSETISGRGFGT